MQTCQFSETQFSFCFTFEYIKQFYPMIPLPIFPNMVMEGRVGGGYDVKINGNVFFQFKIPVYYDIPSNFSRKYWDVFNQDYYKIIVKTDENQFKLLKELSLLDSLNKVYYATPEFYSETDLSQYYESNTIVSRSAIFCLENLPPHGSGLHQLIYSPTQDWGKLFSEPQNIEKSKITSLDEIFADHGNLRLFSSARKISGALLENIPDLKFDFDNPINLVNQVHNTLLTRLNTHWYPIISSRHNPVQFLYR